MSGTRFGNDPYPESFMIDVVIYANENGDKKASAQYGVSHSSIQLWRKRFTVLPSTPSKLKPQCKLTDKSSSKSTQKKPLDDDDTTLKEWIEERLDNEEYPTLLMIGQKAKALHLRQQLWSVDGVRAFLHRTNIHERWSVGAHLRRSKRAGVRASWREKVPFPDDELDQELAAWVIESIDDGCRPLLKNIGMKRVELENRYGAVQPSHRRSWTKPDKWAGRFLARMKLKERWQNALRTEKILKGNSSVGASTPYHAEMEETLLNWISANYTDREPPQSVVMSKAYEIIKEFHIKNFTPTENWFHLIMQRNLKRMKEATHAALISPTENPQNRDPGMDDESDHDDLPSSSHFLTTTNNQSGSFGYQPLSDWDMDDSDKSLPRNLPSSMPDVKDDPAKSLPDESSQPVNKPWEAEKDRHSIPTLRSPSRCNLTANGAAGTSPDVVKRDFGSFHSSNVAEQLKIAETAAYTPPELPVRLPMFEEYSSLPCKFGSTVRKKHFFLEQGCLFLNHGAFGGTMKEALDYYHDWQRYAESQPLRFFDRVFFPQVVHVQKRLANFIGCKPSDITFTTNVTTAINAILQGLSLNKDCSIYYLSLTCGSVKNIIQHVCERSGAKAVEVKVTLPLSKPEDIVSLVRYTLKSSMTLAVFDHIPSNYGFIMPVRELVSLCHQKGVQVLIDGAHGLGQLHLDLSILGADYYVGNCHKWFCSPKGCAFMYVNQQLQRLTRGLIISHGYNGGFHSQFSWTGAKDYCAYLSLHALINFWTTVGPNNIREYCKSLLKEAVDFFQTRWDAELLAPMESHGMMCCVSLPSVLFVGKTVSSSDAQVIQNQLYSEFNIEVPIKCIENKLYVRISAHIYNEFSEYASLASALLAIASPDDKSAFY